MTHPAQSEKDVPETYVVSRYIENPCLIGGRKFDIRVYVLVNSVQVARLFQAVLCDFATVHSPKSVVV